MTDPTPNPTPSTPTGPAVAPIPAPSAPAAPTNRGLRPRRIVAAALPLVAVALAVVVARLSHSFPSEPTRRAREELFTHFRPVTLKNCTFERLGHPGDGGYLFCANLLDGAAAAYSYGIEGRDDWGCEVSKRRGITVHEYDCFDPRRPACAGGKLEFHDECIAGTTFAEGNRVFDTLANQIAANGDAGKRLLMKMDVEGAEWSSFLETPDEVLDRIDQLAVEFHDFDSPKAAEAMDKLQKHFFLVHLHFNNNACSWLTGPWAATAWETLLVNRRLAEVDPSIPEPKRPHPLDAKNIPMLPDCQ